MRGKDRNFQCSKSRIKSGSEYVNSPPGQPTRNKNPRSAASDGPSSIWGQADKKRNIDYDPFKATIPRGFADFKHCIPCADVDIENDEFILKPTGTDSVSK